MGALIRGGIRTDTMFKEQGTEEENRGSCCLSVLYNTVHMSCCCAHRCSLFITAVRGEVDTVVILFVWYRTHRTINNSSRWPMTIPYYYYYYPDESPESNTNKKSNWQEKSKGTTKTRTKGGREKGTKWYITIGNQPPNTGIHKKGKEGELLLVPGSDLVWYRMLHTYPWQRNSYSNCINRERRGRCSGIIIIRMVSIGLYIIHRTWHTILIVISSRRMVITLSYVSQVIHINMTPSYRTINSITQSFVYAGNNTLVIILGGTEEHMHGNEFNK